MRIYGKPAVIGLLLFIIAVMMPVSGARAVLPPGVAQALEQAARETQVLYQNEVILAYGLNDPALAAILVRRAGDRAGDAMSAAVVMAVAQYPMNYAEIIAVAGAMAPPYRDRIAYDAARAFPGFAMGFQPVVLTYGMPSYAPAPLYAPASAPPQPVYSAAVVPLAPLGSAVDDDDFYLDDDAEDLIYDPLESINRPIFWFNDQVDTFLFKPIAQLYGFITPAPAKEAIARGFDNLAAPARFANDLLQGEFSDAGTTGARFLINSSVGIAGLFDIAEDWGHPAQPSDFGQTLYVYDVGSGPYLMVPFLGPTTLRDGLGGLVDSAFHPFFYMFDTVPVNLAISGAEGLVQREAFLGPLDDLRANSIDFYSALRGAYFQNRDTELRRGAQADNAMFDDAFAAFE